MKKYGKNINSDRYVKLDNSMTESAAWTSLSFVSVWVYIELKKRFTLEHGFTRLILPYSKIAWKMSSCTFSKAIKELTHYGFIKYVQHGGLPRRPNIYALSEGWQSKSVEIVHTEGREAILEKQRRQKLTSLGSQYQQ